MTTPPLKRRIGLPLLTAYGVGVMVGAGIVLAGAVLRGGVGYLPKILDIDPRLAILVVGAALVGVAIFSVVDSLALAAAFTAIELIGLTLALAALIFSLSLRA